MWPFECELFHTMARNVTATLWHYAVLERVREMRRLPQTMDSGVGMKPHPFLNLSFTLAYGDISFIRTLGSKYLNGSRNSYSSCQIALIFTLAHSREIETGKG